MTKDKWKRFAVARVVIEHSSKVTPERLFDLLIAADEADLVNLFDDYEVTVFREFEHSTLFDLSCLVCELATRAQETELEVEA